MASTSNCCFSSPVSSPHRLPHLNATVTSNSRRGVRIRLPSAPSSRRLCSPTPVSSSSSSSEEEDYWSAEEADDRYGFEIEVSKISGKRNRRVVRARVRVDAPLQAVWATLTDYEALADFIPGLSECRLLQQDHRFARLYQVGEQDLALGFKFNAKGTIDCYEGDIEIMPSSDCRRREIAFNMVDGDFSFFQGKWSVQEEVDGRTVEEGGEEILTTLSYTVELEPKLWVPVRLLEGRICSEIKNNLISIREQAQRIHRLQQDQVAASACNQQS